MCQRTYQTTLVSRRNYLFLSRKHRRQTVVTSLSRYSVCSLAEIVLPHARAHKDLLDRSDRSHTYRSWGISEKERLLYAFMPQWPEATHVWNVVVWTTVRKDQLIRPCVCHDSVNAAELKSMAWFRQNIPLAGLQTVIPQQDAQASFCNHCSSLF